MKKLLVFLWALLAASASVNAQSQTATLQQGENMTPFYGANAFVEAYNAAQKGAIITLSSGNFNTVDTISKQVTIIGNGCVNNGTTYRTTIGYKTVGDNKICLVINANKVTIEGVCFEHRVHLEPVSDTHFRKCYIDILYKSSSSGSYHKNLVVDQCYVDDIFCTKAENPCVKNSFVGRIAIPSSLGQSYFSNCLIYHYTDIYDVDGHSIGRFTYP